MTTDVLPPLPRMRSPFLCGQLVDECVIGAQHGRVLRSRRTARIHHRAVDLENRTAERDVQTFRLGQRRRAGGDTLDDVRPLTAAGGKSHAVDVLGLGGLGHKPSRPGTGSDQAFAFQHPDRGGDGAAGDAMSSLQDARAGELDAGSIPTGPNGFTQLGGESCCGEATHSSQSRTTVLNRLGGLGAPPCWPPWPLPLARRRPQAALVEMVDIYTLVTHLVTPDDAGARRGAQGHLALCGTDVNPSSFSRPPGNGHCPSCRTSIPPSTVGEGLG